MGTLLIIVGLLGFGYGCFMLGFLYRDKREGLMKSYWFDRGVESVRRHRNKSGCCCVFDEEDNLIKVCAAHVAWKDAASGIGD